MATKDGFLIGEEVIKTPNAKGALNGDFKFNGNSIIGDICIYKDLSEKELQDINKKEFQWTPNLVFKVNFEHNANSSNVEGLVGELKRWVLYRKEVGKDKETKICECDHNKISFIDYKMCGGKVYQYCLYADSDTQRSNPQYTDKIYCKVDGIYILDALAIDNGKEVESYHFLNIEMTLNGNDGRIVINTDKKLNSETYNFLGNNNPKILKTQNDIFRILMKPVSYTEKNITIEFVVCGEV